MKALMIAPQPFFTPRGTPFSIYYRAMVLSGEGVHLDLLTFGEGDDIDLKNVRLIRIPAFRILGPVKIGPSFKKMFLDVFMIIWTVALLIRNRYTFVHAHEEAVFWCRWLKPLFRFRLVYDMHSSLAQQLTNFNFTKSKLLISIFKRLEDSALHAADAVITICPDLRDQVLDAGIQPERHLLIENSIFDDVRTVHSDRSTAVDAIDSTADNVRAGHPGPLILYAGTFEAYQGIELLIEAMAKVSTERQDARLVLVGGTPEQVKGCREIADRAGVAASCLFVGRVPKSVALKFTAMADVLVSPRRHGTNTPLKIYEQIASGRPLIATRIWSHTQVLGDSVCFLVDPQVDSIAEGILDVLSRPDEAKRRAECARELYETQYSRPIYTKKIRDLIALVS